MPILADAEKRSRVLDPAGSFHLTAPAGSGKTFLLVARYLRLLGLIRNPRQVLALTFTNKAAAEMRERVKSYLVRAKKGESSENEAEAELLDYASRALAVHRKFEDILLAGEMLNIRTFHSFCHSVVSQAPFEAGVVPGSVLMEDNEQEFFLRDSVNYALEHIASRREGDSARQAFMSRLLYLNNSWKSLAKEMEDLVNRRGGLAELVSMLNRERASSYFSDKARELVEAELESLKADFEKCRIGREWACFIDETKCAGAEAANVMAGEIPGASWENIPQWLCIADVFLTKQGEVRSRFGPKTGFYSGFTATSWYGAIQDIPAETAEKLHLVRQLPAPGIPVIDADILWDLVVLLNSVLEIYDRQSRAQRMLDYSGIEMAALRLFDSADPSDLQLILDEQIWHILVDEFQDTSREQWELLQKLCAGWQGEKARTVFLVGDPKQSIYSFRKAEVKLFMDARGGLPVEGGGKIELEPLVLDTNFRSQPHLIEWCNRVFENTVMAEHRPEFDEVPFSAAKPSPALRTDADQVPIELALFLEWPDKETARAREAEWLAGKLAGHLRENSRNSQAAILLFSRTHLTVYLEALQNKNVPVQVKEGLKLRERPEVFYLWQLSRGIVMPHDDLAWAAQLRSPWFNLDFQQIYSIARLPGDLWAEKIRLFVEQDPDAACFRQAMASAWQHVGHQPLADVVESSWLELDGSHLVLSRWGSRGLNSCRRFLQMLREAEQGEPVRTLARLEQLLQNAYEPVDPDTARSNVVLSTVHGAKGLEFDSVFIPYMDWGPDSGKKDQSPPYLIERSPRSGDYLLASKPDRLTGEKNPLYSWLLRLRSRKQLGEAKRLFYVAVTRARRELVVSGIVKQKGNSFSTIAKSPLGWLDRHYGVEQICNIGAIECQDTNDSSNVNDWKTSVICDDGFTIQIEPGSGEIEVSPGNNFQPEIAPAWFEPEKPAFVVVSPSMAAAGPQLSDVSKRPGIQNLSDDRLPRSACPPGEWGTLVHRLLAHFGKTGALPSAQSVCAALAAIGLEGPGSMETALDALSEVEFCLADPWLHTFYSIPPDRRKVEWPAECAHSPDVVFSGVIDLAAQIEGRWKLVDFKTSMPSEGENIEDFVRREMGTYRDQVLSYAEIWEKLTRTDPNEIDAFIYWTALRKYVQV